MAEENETIDNGETEVQVTAVGEVIGTGSSGEPVKQEFTEEALQKIAETHDDVLVDVDHESEREGKTAAAGWLKKLHVIPGKGLFGKISWTDIGRKLIDNRVFRFLSPAFLLDSETHEPVAMTSVALTNKPSQAGMIQPIINQAPEGRDAEAHEENLENTQEKITMEMTKEELVALIKEVLAEGAAQETAHETAQETGVKEAAIEQPAENAEPEEPAKEEAKEEVKEEAKEEVKEEAKEEVKEEVIKLETLNSAPAPTLAPQPAKWRSLEGKAFIDWVNNGMR